MIIQGRSIGKGGRTAQMQPELRWSDDHLAACLACAVTGAGLALADSGAQLYDIPVGVVVDMTKFERSSGRLCAAVLPQLQQIAMLYGGDVQVKNPEAFRQALSQAIQTASLMAATIKQCIQAQLENRM
ncbi:hypothetical protein D915_010600 [Fasciola hepatica]|uniref:Uncharacterized protein n=1 Tax=Fasciola hepatica TaxID=6192 RepID=A0A4E0QUA9_FASHE|nr:hypothetical protein D915_010600 [Fasciola hepatica]